MTLREELEKKKAELEQLLEGAVEELDKIGEHELGCKLADVNQQLQLLAQREQEEMYAIRGDPVHSSDRISIQADNVVYAEPVDELKQEVAELKAQLNHLLAILDLGGTLGESEENGSGDVP